MRNKSTRYYVFLVCVAILAFVVRLYKIQNPIADWHSWRQSDTAAVARNFLSFGIDPIHPRYDDLSNIQSGHDNPMGWRMVEFPLYQTIGAGLEKLAPGVPLEIWLRFVTIVSSVGICCLIGLMVGEFIDPITGLFAAFIYAILPYSIYYGRTILPDTFMVFWALLSLWLTNSRKNIGSSILGGLAGALAMLAKPMAAFLLIPIIWIQWRKFGFSKRLFIDTIIYGIICLLPFILWRRWIVLFPEGIPVSTWLLNGNNIRFKGAWFHWLFAERLGDLILGFWGLIPFGLGLAVVPSKKEGWFFRYWILGILLYFIIFATGNVQHDYYQILIIPGVAVFVAKGLSYLWNNHISIGLYSGKILVLVCITAIFGFSWFTIRTYYWINRPEIIEAGRAADALLPKNAKVIAPYNGDTTFLYQTRRQGWPIGFDIDKKIEMGATAYVTVSPTDKDTETMALAEKYRVLVRNDTYAIIDLTHKNMAK